MTSKISGFRETLQAVRGGTPDRFSLGWTDGRQGYGEAWGEGKAAGSAVGTSLSERMNKQIDKLTKNLNNPAAITNGIQDAFNFNSDNSLTVSDPTLVDITDDYRELLSQRAADRFNMKFSQVTPQITIENVEVHGNEDLLNESIEVLADGLEEVSNNTGKGAA